MLSIVPLFTFAMGAVYRKSWRKEVGPFDLMMVLLVFLAVSLALRPKTIIFEELFASVPSL